MKNKIAIFLMMLLSAVNCVGQNRNSVWCFGDSAGIDFNNLNNPVPISTGLRTRGSCASIADTSGNLLFYANDRTNTAGNYTTLVYNSQHQIMPNGDSIVGEGWYNEIVILPWPENDSLYYLFCISTVLGPRGLYYSVINMNADSGRGDVILKNVQLKSFGMVDCLKAIKHGNGRDWWLFFRKYENLATADNLFHSYLITSQGPIDYSFQSIGSINKTNLGQLNFNAEGSKAIFNNFRGLLELYDFDRCTGLLSNPLTIYQENNPTGPWPVRWSSEFSSNGDILYVSSTPDTTYLIQYDLNASNIALSGDTIWTFSDFFYSGHALKRGPDDKIYFSCCYQTGLLTYPYADSIYNPINMNLGVINSPNNLGATCDFQPFSFYLGGKRTYWGLPNNPNYDMPALAGSVCDSLVGLSETTPTIITSQLNIFYHPQWQTAFINASNLTGTKGTMEIFDVLGKLMHREEIEIQNGYYTRNFNMTGMADGMYFVNLISAGQRLTQKFVKE